LRGGVYKGGFVRKFKLWDTKEEMMLGPFTLDNIRCDLDMLYGAVGAEAVLKKGECKVKLRYIGGRYIECSMEETREDLLEKDLT